jgi:hypothetical protein
VTLGDPIYLLDANALIQAARQYYAFDIAPRFWTMLVEHAKAGKIGSIDRIADELAKGNDALAAWAKSDFASAFLTTDDGAVLASYRHVMTWVERQAQFFDAAKAEFAGVADGWLIAYAIAKDCTVVTHEAYAPQVRKNVPIPNVCAAFGVRCVDTFVMMRELHVRLA